ncbi:bifunctional adenosylcobinamide kinase/adenosylcobinamide-phosphate guanylyltransferase [Acidiphilium sp.]|uniref:bifunctional adenosylcobinamide kinase/adenosylcobinamide-phosphate guanylyltransferase n=1 Tax=Acidiphilium sp. TaxID=527 RepID=UPI003CFD0E32
MEPTITLILGGARCGKSRHAEALLTAHPAPWHYIATAQAFDDEMRDRIARHRARRDAGWHTIEAPLDLATPLTANPATPVLIDCLTLWLTNLLLAGADLATATATLAAALRARTAPSILVGSEVGLGIVPDNALARRFRDEAGLLHQHLAAQADRVILMVAGLPLTVK